MSYGLEVKSGTNNDIIIADTNEDLSNYVAVEHAIGSKTTVDVNLARDLVFVRHTPVKGPNIPHDVVTFRYQLYDTGVPNPAYTEGSLFVTENIMAYETVLTFSFVLEYIILKPASDVTPDSSSEEYGLQIINKENRVQFDSRVFTSEKTIKLEEYFPPRSVALITNPTTAELTILRSDLINSSFNYFYSMNDDNDVSSIGLFVNTNTTRALLFVPTGTNNFGNSQSATTIPSGVYASKTSVTVGLFGDVTMATSEPPDFIIYRGSLVE